MCARRLTVGLFALCAVCLRSVTAAEPTPEIEWLITEEGGLSNPLVAGGLVFVGTDAGLVRAFETKTGKEAWRYSHGARICDRPECDSDRVYVISEDRGVTALNRRDGSYVWSKPIKGGFGALAVAPEPKLVFLGGYDGMVRALDASTGDERWATNVVKDAPPDRPGFDGTRARFRGRVAARPAAATCDGQWVFVSLADQSRVVGLDTSDGAKKFDYQAGGWVFGGALVDRGCVFIGSQDRALYCIDRDTGQFLWSFRTQGRIDASAAVEGEKLYFGSDDGAFYCVDRATGDEVWKFDVETDAKHRKGIACKPLIVDDTICFAAGEGQVYVLDLASGALRWKFRPLEDAELFTSPASDGRFVFVTARPRLGQTSKPALIAIDPYFGQ